MFFSVLPVVSHLLHEVLIVLLEEVELALLIDLVEVLEQEEFGIQKKG